MTTPVQWGNDGSQKHSLMNPIPKILAKIDSFQRKHGFFGFSYAVIKKYGDDEAGYQAALLTYYGFLSLFPLLLVLTTVITILAGRHAHLRDTIIRGTTDYFPTLGNQLSQHVGTLHKSGLALIIGVLFTLYGTRGIADAFRHGVNHLWRVPKVDRSGFPKSAIRSLAIVIIGGVGFVLAAVIAGYAATAGHGLGFLVLSVGINLVILFWVFLFLIKVSLPIHISFREVEAGAAAAAIGLVILQSLGTHLLARQLKNLNALYSNFALVLGLLFWIYLQSQMVYYAVEIATVKAQGLWPRSLTGKDLTEADKLAFAHQAKKEKRVDEETISTRF